MINSINNMFRLKEQPTYISALKAEYYGFSFQRLAKQYHAYPNERDFINDFVKSVSTEEFAKNFRKAKAIRVKNLELSV